jgi:peroxiredoxin Q/BCP
MKRLIRAGAVLAATLLASNAAALQIGDAAPDFTAMSTRGEVTLSQALEKRPVVLALYYADFTPGWTSELQAFQNDINRFEKLGAQVLGVSADSLETHKDFVKKLGLNFSLLVDDGSIRKNYGSGRLTYLIDTSGIIRYVHKGMPDNDRLIEEVGKLQSRWTSSKLDLDKIFWFEFDMLSGLK